MNFARMSGCLTIFARIIKIGLLLLVTAGLVFGGLWAEISAGLGGQLANRGLSKALSFEYDYLSQVQCQGNVDHS